MKIVHDRRARGELPADDPSHRFVLQLCLSEPGESESWDSLLTTRTLRESLAACSECTASIQLMMGVDPVSGPELSVVRLRVWDRQSCRMIFWEDERGALRWDSSLLPNGLVARSWMEEGISS